MTTISVARKNGGTHDHGVVTVNDRADKFIAQTGDRENLLYYEASCHSISHHT